MFRVLRVKIGSGVYPVGRWKNPKKKPSKHFDAQFRAYGERGKETPGGIATKFCMTVDIQDVITCATFCDDRLTGLGVAYRRIRRISRFPIDFRHRPYKILYRLHRSSYNVMFSIHGDRIQLLR